MLRMSSSGIGSPSMVAVEQVTGEVVLRVARRPPALGDELDEVLA